MAERSDWVEIIEPRWRERMYVNLLTGECGWEPPPNLGVRKADEKQWWELFDQQSSRFYYYNAISQQTVWHRPQNCDIVPLAQLQAMKRSSQLELRGRVHRGSTSSDGRSTPAHAMEKDKEAASARADSLESRRDSGREASHRWQPAPGTKAAMLVKVNSLKHVPTSPPTAGQQQEGPGLGSSQKPLSKPVSYAQPQQAAQITVPTRAASPTETKQSMQVKKTDSGGFCLVLTGGTSYQTPQRTPTSTLQPESPKHASPPPIYDEPSVESPIYDEPPVEMDIEGVTMNGTTPHISPSSSLQKQLQPTKLLQHPSMQQQISNRHKRNPSATEYSPAGREYIKHMVNVDQSSKQPAAPHGTTEVSAKLQPGPLTSKESFKQSWRVLEANVLKNIEAHHSRQNSLQTQEYPTVISQQDSGYSTGPSPSLRKRKGRRQGAAQVRPGSVGSSSELNMLNDKLIAEMRAVVGRSAVCKGSKASLDADMVETTVLSESSKVRFQPEPLKKYGSRGSRDDVRSSNRSLYRSMVESKASDSSDFSTQQDVVRQKRTYEKIDSLEKTVTSQTSLVSSESTRTTSQSGTLETNSKTETLQQPGVPVYTFTYTTIRKPLSENSMVDWASKNLNMHTQGIFRRRISIANMLSWNGGSIKKPMLITSNHMVKKEACEMFKLVQMYMGDRQARTDRNHVALVTVTKCWSVQGLRDELYIQLVRQTTDNMGYRSLALGWELMAISLAFFSPSPKFQSYLEGYIYRHLDQVHDENINQRIKELQELKNKKNSKSRKKRKQNTEEEGLPISTYAKYCYRKLQKVAVTGGKKGLKKPSVEEIEHARNAICTPSLFGSSLEEVMLRQRDTFPDRRLPWVQTQLSQQVLALGGERTEGIFRVPGDIDEVNALKLQVDQWRIPDNLEDPTVPASLLKLWYRELEEPLIPQQFYKQCISNYENPDAAVAVVQLLPELNRLVLCYLIHFLQIFAQPANVGTTKMDVNNLAMVMAPNCLRCQSDDPRVIFENTRKEMSFLRMLIVHLDTSFIRRIL
ncbi:rho GTPase-activating protein 39-like [Rhinatrema bivittatum]|uniref:rho GTPase-activating protein 39-like n=1 Tax=Rhinatrema bivittatum TaxID=194408 RepID=UPI00112C0714|nr:rho GTPase-activating protein 39-like [Rhinatrema bivittatum]